MKREEALKLLRQIEAYRKTPAMHEANAPGLFCILQTRAGYIFLKPKCFTGIILGLP